MSLIKAFWIPGGIPDIPSLTPTPSPGEVYRDELPPLHVREVLKFSEVQGVPVAPAATSF